MANWFEDNPTKSVIGYTLVLSATVWAISTFVLKDNAVQEAKEEAASKSALAEEYKAKADLLSADLAELRAENAEYRAWLEKSTDAVPIMVPQLRKLRERVAELEKSPLLAGTAASTTTTATGVLTPAPNDPSVTVQVGSSYIDPITGAVFGVKHVSVDNTADVQLTLPGQRETNAIVNPGKQWVFKFNGKPYAVTLREVRFISDTVKIQIAPTP